jgi:hypothetical protein
MAYIYSLVASDQGMSHKFPAHSSDEISHEGIGKCFKYRIWMYNMCPIKIFIKEQDFCANSIVCISFGVTGETETPNTLFLAYFQRTQMNRPE